VCLGRHTRSGSEYLCPNGYSISTYEHNLGPQDVLRPLSKAVGQPCQAVAPENHLSLTAGADCLHSTPTLTMEKDVSLCGSRVALV
jgi:hypothetical protein